MRKLNFSTLNRTFTRFYWSNYSVKYTKRQAISDVPANVYTRSVVVCIDVQIIYQECCCMKYYSTVRCIYNRCLDDILFYYTLYVCVIDVQMICYATLYVVCMCNRCQDDILFYCTLYVCIIDVQMIYYSTVRCMYF